MLVWHVGPLVSRHAAERLDARQLTVRGRRGPHRVSAWGDVRADTACAAPAL